MNKLLRGITVLGLTGAVLLCSCTTNLGPETLPSITTATETTIETEPTETEPTLPPEATEPSSVAVVTDSIVENEGTLSVSGTKIVNSEGEEVVLKGMSTFGIQNCEGFFTEEVVKTLAEDWGCDVLRIALTGDKDIEGYLKDPDKYFDMVCKICDLCIDQGIYVIVDWNVAYYEDAEETKEACVDFFTRLSAIYSDSPNLIYEVNNYPLFYEEPDEDADEVPNEWEDMIKPFATDVINAVRENNPDCIVIVGVPNNGLDINAVSESWLEFENIIYGCRVFSGSNKQEMRDNISLLLDEEACVFITEWSFCTEYLKGGIFRNESEKWALFLEANGISWCSVGIGSDIDNDTNALLLNAENYTDAQKYGGHWPDGLLSDAGLYARELLLSEPSAQIDTETTEPAGEETESTEDSYAEDGEDDDDEE